MDVRMTEEASASPLNRAAEAEIRKCVHCGMCLAHCPTHILWGNELDSPRGRIYQVKSVLEGEKPRASLQLHLDRCLTCRACESACPSDVKYGVIAEAGRKIAADAELPPRPLRERFLRTALANLAGRPKLMALLVAMARPFLFLSPVHARMLAKGKEGAPIEAPKGRKFALFPGCVQRSAGAGTNKALTRLFAAAGIELETVESRCCGALDLHLGRHEQAHKTMKQNVDMVRARLESGELEGVVMAASGCVVMLKEYASHFRGEGDAEEGAKLFGERSFDPAQVIDKEWEALEGKLEGPEERVAFHAPCTLQHGQGLKGIVEGILDRAGYSQVETDQKEICCGAAGSYFVIYPGPSGELRERKLRSLLERGPERVLSSNIGCILHLRAGTSVPVSHWAEALAERLK